MRAAGPRRLARALCALPLGLALSSPAWALPPPLLGPDGPLHVGPLRPADEDPRGVVVVDPRTGALHLSLPGAAGTFAWQDGAWTRDGAPLSAGDEPPPEPTVNVVEDLLWTPGKAPPAGSPAGSLPDLAGREIVPDGARWTWGERGLLTVVDRQGGIVRIAADERGAPRGLSWPDGTRIEVKRDEFGRVVRLDGPGPGVLQLVWRDGGLVVTDPLGAPLTVRPGPGQQGATRSLLVIDSLGRQARAFYGPDPLGQERLVGWEDPRGLQAWVRWAAPRVEVVDGAGRTWRVELDPQGRILRVADPSAARWAWRRDAAGEVVGVEDPAGRIHGWERDRLGRLVGVGRGAVPWRLRRDEAGRVVELVDPVGGVVRLQRDGAGRVVRIEDALGNEVELSRTAAGAVEAVTGRAGERWRLERDLLGRVSRVVGSDDRRLELRRDAAGRLVSLRDPARGGFTLDRSATGALTRLRGPAGEAVGLLRDGLGRLSALRWAEGVELALRRDAAGEVVQVVLTEAGAGEAGAGEVGPVTVAVQRDAAEAPVRVGAVAWRRDGAGRVRGIDAPGRSLELSRDGAGLLAGVRAGAWSVQLMRDGAGRVVRWSGTDGQVEVRRNPGGRITREVVSPAAGGALLEADPLLAPPAAPSEGEGSLGEAFPVDPSLETAPLPGPVAVESSFDLRGRLQRLDLDLPGLEPRGWRILRDAAGRLLRVTGPGALALGVDRDPAGRVVLIRHAAHSLLRVVRGEDDVVLVVEDAGGRRLAARLARLDARGRVVEDEDPIWGPRTWRRDARGRLLAVDLAGQEAWRFGRAAWRGPDGSEVLFDAAGRVATARPPAGAPAWAAGGATLSYAWDDAGRLSFVAGELGAVRVVHDALGRLAAVEPEVGPAWTLRYDARGRLARVERDGRTVEWLTWGPAVDDGPAALLASGAAGGSTWLPGRRGPAGAQGTGEVVDVVAGLEGHPWWLVPRGGVAVPRSADLRGYPELGLADDSGVDLVGPAGALQPFAGGPLLALAPAEGGAVPAGVALDPVSGQRVDGLSPWPWADPGPWADGGPGALDPAPWAPTGPWQQPLRLLVAMGELDEPVPGDWTPLPGDPPALPWLPASLDGDTQPPLGPPLHALPLGEDPLTTAWLLACLPGAAPEAPDLAAREVVAAELDLPWLPPGIELPLPWGGRPAAGAPLPDAAN